MSIDKLLAPLRADIKAAQDALERASVGLDLLQHDLEDPVEPEQPEPEPETPAPEPEQPVHSFAVHPTNDSLYKNGIRNDGKVIQLRNSAEARQHLKKGESVTLQDGSQRKIEWAEESGGAKTFLNIHVSGGSVPASQGHPNSISVGALDGAEPAPEAPKPEVPKPNPKPGTGGKPQGWNREDWFLGLNQAGGDFGGVTPGTFGTHYTYPDYNHLKGARDKGFKFARFPFKRGRLQHTVRGPLNQTEVGRVRKFLDDCQSLGIAVKTDPHDYFKIEGREATAVELIDFHLKFLAEFGSHPAIVMIGLQNEPTGTSGRWNRVANDLVKEIRTVTDKLINVPGDSYQSVTRWMKENPLYPLDYPNLCYGGHLYMDWDASGTWNRGRTANVDPMQGVRMLEGWIKNFLEPNDCYGHLGETGVPWENPSALLAMDNLLAYAKSQPRILGVTIWADGPWWGVNKEGIPPVNAIRSNGKWHEPIMQVLQKHV